MLYSTLQSLLDAQLHELYAAEVHVSREMKCYVDGAVSSELKAQLVKYGGEAERRAEALEALLKKRDLDPHQSRCRVIDVLIKKGHDIIQSRGSDAMLDFGLVLTMRAIAAYEQNSYEDAKTIAEAIGKGEMAKVLEKHQREDGQQERSFMALAEDMVDALVTVSSKARQSSDEGVGGVQA